MSINKSNSSLNNINNIHQFEALFNFATIGIVVTNNNGLIINFNRYAQTQFDYTKEEILGKKVEILLPDGRTFNFSDFKLSPPTKMAGFIKIKDAFDVNFQLMLRTI